MKRSDRFDAILASVPSDATAAKVTGRGEHWDPKKAVRDTHIHSEVPLPFTDIPNDPGTVGLRAGLTFGRLTVLGKHIAKRAWDGKARYVVRCVCGSYEVRSARAIRNADPKASCEACSYQRTIREGYHKDRDWHIGAGGVVKRGGAQ